MVANLEIFRKKRGLSLCNVWLKTHVVGLKAMGKNQIEKIVFIYKKEIINKIKRQLTEWDVMDNMFIFLM